MRGQGTSNNPLKHEIDTLRAFKQLNNPWIIKFESNWKRKERLKNHFWWISSIKSTLKLKRLEWTKIQLEIRVLNQNGESKVITKPLKNDMEKQFIRVKRED